MYYSALQQLRYDWISSYPYLSAIWRKKCKSVSSHFLICKFLKNMTSLGSTIQILLYKDSPIFPPPFLWHYDLWLYVFVIQVFLYFISDLSLNSWFLIVQLFQKMCKIISSSICNEPKFQFVWFSHATQWQ